jgi:hypothetical protein
MAKYKGYDFCGWATRNDLRCSDGRTIRSGAFAHQDGMRVPLVWGHDHTSPEAVLGHGYLENRPEGVFFYGYFNDSELAKSAKRDVMHGDITALSIWANQLKQKAGDVLHGSIKEVSLVLSGANVGAQITYPIIAHGEDTETIMDEAYITMGDEYGIEINHSDMDDDDTEDDTYDDSSDWITDPYALEHDDTKDLKKQETTVQKGDNNMDDDMTVQEVLDTMNENQLKVLSYLVGVAASENDNLAHADMDDDATVEEVIATMNKDQKDVLEYLIDQAVADAVNDTVKHFDDEGETFMNFNAFEMANNTNPNVISHGEQETILEYAKRKDVGSLKMAMQAFAEENNLSHDDLADVSGFTSYPTTSGGVTVPAGVDSLFPEWHDVRPGAPELVTNDQAWVKAVLNKVHRSPYSRIRTAQVDIREVEGLRAKGYKKGTEKALVDNYTAVKRTTEPTTIYVKSALNRDDIVDITDFDYVAYQYNIDKQLLEKEVATAIMIGDGRDAAAPDKIDPLKIRPIYSDDSIYTIRKVLTLGNSNGTNTGANFGDGYRYAQAMEEALLDAKIDYRGSGAMDMFCTQQFFNKMILAKDMNGRRLYNNKNELTSALDIQNVYNVPEFDGVTRTVTVGNTEKTYKLLAIIGNMADYNIGATKGGEITHFQQFDIDFNQEKSLIETRMSGANTRIYSFIVIEEEVVNP